MRGMERNGCSMTYSAMSTSLSARRRCLIGLRNVSFSPKTSISISLSLRVTALSSMESPAGVVRRQGALFEGSGWKGLLLGQGFHRVQRLGEPVLEDLFQARGNVDLHRQGGDAAAFQEGKTLRAVRPLLCPLARS